MQNEIKDSPQLIPQWEAKAKGLTTYYTGVPCKHGHLDYRYVKSRACITCQKAAVLRLKDKHLIRKLKKKEEQINAKGFIWTQRNRNRLIEVFIDTGDIAHARDEIAVTPSLFQKELDENKDFRKQYETAKPLAAQHLKERAIQLGLRGNDKLLQVLLKANFEEFRESDKIKVDVNSRSQVAILTDAQLDAGLAALISKYRDKFAIEGEVEERTNSRADPKLLEAIPDGEGGASIEVEGSRREGDEEPIQENVS